MLLMWSRPLPADEKAGHEDEGLKKVLRSLSPEDLESDRRDSAGYKLYEVLRRLARHSPRAEANNAIAYNTVQ